MGSCPLYSGPAHRGPGAGEGSNRSLHSCNKTCCNSSCTDSPHETAPKNLSDVCTYNVGSCYYASVGLTSLHAGRNRCSKLRQAILHLRPTLIQRRTYSCSWKPLMGWIYPRRRSLPHALPQRVFFLLLNRLLD